jgi:hypothetical protein
MQTKNIKLGKYRHYRTKKDYQVLGSALHSETYEPMVIYQALYDCEKFGDKRIWVRPLEMFLGQVLENEAFVARFEYIDD